MMELSIKPVYADNLDDLGRLFNAHEMTENCWCMWWLIAYKEWQKAGAEGNQRSFRRLAAESELPMGLLAYHEGEPVGWCAIGPRERYARAIKTPSYRGGDPEEEGVWLAPCFFIHPDLRGQGVAGALLAAAADLAREQGARAVEGFPYAGDTRRSGGSTQVGVEPLFSGCDFKVLRRTSEARVVMRRELE